MNGEIVGTYETPHGRTAHYRLISGDCMEILPLLPERAMDLILTDIPYGEVNRPNAGIREFDKGAADVETFELTDFVRECVGLLKGSIYVFCGSRQLSGILDEFVDRDLVHVRPCAWHKPNPSPANGQYGWLSALELCAYARRPKAVFNEDCGHNLWEHPTVRYKDRKHPTQKPLELLTRLILASSDIGDIVLDPCMGSGATGEAALLAGRDFIGIELADDYFGVAVERLAQLSTGTD